MWRGGIWGVERLDLEVIGRGVDGETEGTTQPGVALHACRQKTGLERWGSCLPAADGEAERRVFVFRSSSAAEQASRCTLRHRFSTVIDDRFV